MRFNPKAKVDTSHVTYAGRGRGGGSLQGLPIPSGAAGGGIGGAVILIIIFLVVQFSGGGGLLGGDDVATDPGQDPYAECRTGADAADSSDCARALVENSLRGFWTVAYPDQTGKRFSPAADVVTFTDAVSTGGCGNASSGVGPFYCPLDKKIYLDPTFFDQVLEGQLGGEGGDFVEPYVLAHEYGHHIQNLLGTMSKVKTQQGANSDAVRLELQADCYAGMWAKGATGTTDASGVRIFQSITEADINEAIDAARTVGDDNIQQTSGGRVDKEGWTHGSSAQRIKWFKVGLSAGTVKACDTFAVRNV